MKFNNDLHIIRKVDYIMVRRLKEAYWDGWFDHNSIDNEAKINLLGRLIADCEYFLGYGYGYEGHLWAETVEDQIYAMRDLYSQIGDLQDMITEDEIDDYERRMLDVKYNKRKNESAESVNRKRVQEDLGDSVTIDDIVEICDSIKEDVDTVSRLASKYPENYNSAWRNYSELKDKLVDISTRLYLLWN